MKHFALIGYPLGHSYSKQWFDEQHFADADYRLCPMSSLEGLRPWVEREHINGFNITSPHKMAILPYLDSLSPEAEAIGAVNCVCVERHVTQAIKQSNNQAIKLIGHNTDAPAFRQTFLSLNQSSNQEITQSFILGTGGAARAVAYALEQLAIPYHFVSRTPHLHPNAISYTQLNQAIKQSSNQTIIINATPVGTYPDVDTTPIHYIQAIKQSSNQSFLVYDLIYNPAPTLLLQQAAIAGAVTKDGLEMLHIQARLSWQLWGIL